METFSTLLILFERYPLITGGFPSQRPVTRSFDVFFDLHLNKRLSKQSRRQWFETQTHSLRRHCNAMNQWWSRSLTHMVSLATITYYPKYCTSVLLHPYTNEIWDTKCVILVVHWQVPGSWFAGSYTCNVICSGSGEAVRVVGMLGAVSLLRYMILCIGLTHWSLGDEAIIIK